MSLSPRSIKTLLVQALVNQCAILETLDALLYAPGVTAHAIPDRNLHRELQACRGMTMKLLDKEAS